MIKWDKGVVDIIVNSSVTFTDYDDILLDITTVGYSGDIKTAKVMYARYGELRVHANYTGELVPSVLGSQYLINIESTNEMGQNFSTGLSLNALDAHKISFYATDYRGGTPGSITLKVYGRNKYFLDS